jgi:hypothetical protein
MRKNPPPAYGSALSALERCETLLDATIRYLNNNPIQEYKVHYDEADCDGYCLADDCLSALLEVREALRRKRSK